MKERYRLFLRRKSVYYAFDNTTKTFASLKTKDKLEATRLLIAMNEAGKQPAMNLGLARVYLKHSDPMVTQRTWQHVLDEIIALKSGPTQYRWGTAAKDKAFDLIRSRLLIETQAEHFLQVLKKGTVSTNAYLRKTHNFALDMNWLPASVIPRRQWPAIHFKEKRAITFEEHQQIIAGETNPERRNLYQLCWHLGASQGDIAALMGFYETKLSGIDLSFVWQVPSESLDAMKKNPEKWLREQIDRKGTITRLLFIPYTALIVVYLLALLGLAIVLYKKSF
jgi:hypothetical protein